MNANQISALTTSELVSLYNEKTGKSIKKFSSRAAGEKQVAALFPVAASRNEVAHKIASSALEFAKKSAAEKEAKKSAKAASKPVKAEKPAQAVPKAALPSLLQQVTAINSTAPKAEQAATKSKAKEPVDRAAAIAASWKDPEVAAKRSERTHVKAGNKVFRSVREAFTELRLPLSKHIKFRMQLKEVQELTFKHEGRQITFHVVQDQE